MAIQTEPTPLTKTNSIGFPPASSRQQIWARVLFALAIALAGFAAVRVVSTWPTRLSYPGEGDFVEGQQMAEMLHLRQGHPIYQPAESDRFDDAIYGPLYYLLGSCLLSPSAPTYFALRLVSLLATFSSLAGTALLSFWLTRRLWAAVLAPLVCLCGAFVAQPAISARCDALAAALAFTGFVLAYRFRNSRLILLSTAPMLLAFFYKQLFVGGALGVFVYLLLERRYRLAAQFATLMAGGILGGLALCQWVLFRNQAFLTHVVFYNLLPFRSREITYGLVMFCALLGIPLAAAIHFLLKRRDKLLICYVACCTLIPLLVIGKAGSYVNYLAECSIVLLALLACEITGQRRSILQSVICLAMLAVTLRLNFPLATRRPSAEDFARDQTVQLFLREHFPPGTPAAGYYSGDLVRAGLDIRHTSLWHYVQLVRQGTLSGDEFLGDIQARKFGVIMLDFDQKPNRDDAIANRVLTPEYRSAILANYTLLAVLPMPGVEKTTFSEGQVFLWVPRDDLRAARGNVLEMP